MKNSLLIGFALFFFSCQENQEVKVGEPTTMKFDQTTFHAGVVMKGEKVRAVFKVTNTGDHPLVFGEVRPSCSCTLAEKPKKPILPGKTGAIVALVNTDNLHTSRIHKLVTVMANTEPNIVVLEIKGRIK
ncbi:MAG: hypothetical protein RLZZ301_1546 [Bacteroidota bacterium]|jgi:hypothetical protein